MVKKIREKIAVFFARRRMFPMFCFVRGNHTALNQVGRCLACGKTNGSEPKTRITPIVNRPIRSIAANDEIGRRESFVRNSIVREEAKRYGY